MSRGRRRDRWVYLASHPVLFALLAATRRQPVRGMPRLGSRWRRSARTVLVHGTDAYREVLTGLPLDRLAEGTTGGAARAVGAGEVLFDQQGPAHRAARRDVAADLGSQGVGRLRPVWTAVLERRLAPLDTGGRVDMVDVAAEVAGATVAAMLRIPADPCELARAARDAAAATARAHLPGLRRPSLAPAREAADRLTGLLGTGDGPAAMLAVAAVNTTVAGLPRAVAWCADDHLWPHAGNPELVSELLRVTAPTPVLPRVSAADGLVAGRQVRAGDRLLLVTRHAAQAHRQDPDPADPLPPAVAQLVFGAGPHACPGAALARAQLADTLAALAPYRPVVVGSRVDRRSALPGWARLVIEAGPDHTRSRAASSRGRATSRSRRTAPGPQRDASGSQWDASGSPRTASGPRTAR